MTTLYEDDEKKFLEITGTAAADYLHRMTSQEILKQPVGDGRYGALLDRKGMVLSFFYLVRREEGRFLLVGNPLAVTRAKEILNKMKFAEKVTIQELPWRAISLIGDGAGEIVKKVTSPDVVAVQDKIFPTPFWDLFGPEEAIGAILANSTLTSLPRTGREVAKLLQMQIGLPEYGVDIGEQQILLEAPVPYAYQRQKGCYPGQEVIERISTYGKGRAPRSLVTFSLDGKESLQAKSDLFTPEGEKAGYVTSALFDPTTGKTLVMASIEHKYLTHISQGKPLSPLP